MHVLLGEQDRGAHVPQLPQYSPIRSTMIGASPSLGSSSSRPMGLPISVRAMVEHLLLAAGQAPAMRCRSGASSGNIS